jgi:hypothetical protein
VLSKIFPGYTPDPFYRGEVAGRRDRREETGERKEVEVLEGRE